MSLLNIALNASINRKQQPNALFVHGSVMVHSSNYEISLRKAEPQGINPEILILNLTVVEHPGLMKGTPRAFSYEEQGDHVNEYKQVQVVTNHEDSVTVDIVIFG